MVDNIFNNPKTIPCIVRLIYKLIKERCEKNTSILRHLIPVKKAVHAIIENGNRLTPHPQFPHNQ